MDWWSPLLAGLLHVVARTDDGWVGTLARLDAQRAAAFAQRDPTLLDDVYVAGSASRASDARSIERYARRGARVEGALLLTESLVEERRAGDVARLRVVDRLAPARVVWDDGTVTALPRDRPTRRVVTLVLTENGWRIGGSALR